jgi:hypothetical protein
MRNIDFRGVINFSEVVDNSNLQSEINKFFVIDRDNIMYILNNINYRAFDDIKDENDMKNISFMHVINFMVDNRYGVSSAIKIRPNMNISDFPFSRVIKIKNIKRWFNYLELISILTHMAAQSRND